MDLQLIHCRKPYIFSLMNDLTESLNYQVSFLQDPFLVTMLQSSYFEKGRNNDKLLTVSFSDPDIILLVMVSPNNFLVTVSLNFDIAVLGVNIFLYLFGNLMSVVQSESLYWAAYSALGRTLISSIKFLQLFCAKIFATHVIAPPES